MITAKWPSNTEAFGVVAWLLIPAPLFALFIGQIWLCAGLALAGIGAIPLIQLADGDAAGALRHRTLLPGCLALAFILTMIGGEGRLFPATTDWIVRDAVLHDVVIRSWPFTYRLGNDNWMLRAPIGMYLIPATVGKLFGLYAAHIALWIQNGFALGTIIWILCRAATIQQSLILTTVFCLFSGWDVAGWLIIDGVHYLAFHQPTMFPADIGWWNGLLQYSSTVTLILWVPNHALAGWFFVALLLLWEQRRLRISALMMGALLTALWSPFALMGALPFIGKAGVEALWQRRFGAGDFAVPILLFCLTIPLLQYLTSDTGGVPQTFEAPVESRFAPVYVIFMAVEVVPFVVFNFIGRRHQGGFSHATYYLAVAVLFAIPFYKIGSGDDFVMRASIPALAIVAITTGYTVSGILARGRPWPVAATVMFLGLSAFTGLGQIWHVLTAPNNGISTCDFVQAWRQDEPGTINNSSMAPYLAEESHLPASLRPAHPQIYPTSPDTSPCKSQRL
jgi:hypothetical protein